MLAWTLFAFGAVYPWASRPAVAATGLLFLLALPSFIGRESLFSGSTWPLDTALALFVLFGWFQYMPLPPGVVNALSPASAAFHQSVELAQADPQAWRPLTLAPTASIDALLNYTAALLFFWIVRESIGGSGARTVARSTAVMGGFVVLLAVLHPVLFPNGKIYGFWEPIYAEAHPVGPIISRNHFASWMVLALPVAAGYLVMHAHTRWVAGSRRVRLIVRILSDLRALWITTAAALMLAGVLFSQSRAGLIGLSVAAVVGLAGAWRGLRRRGRAGVLALAVLLAVSGWAVAHPENVLRRIEKTAPGEWGGRPVIWRATMAMAAEYRLVGVGLGAYEGAMPVYQASPRRVIFNHAHSQYLQLWAESGIIGTLLGAVIFAAAASLVARRIRQDRSAFVQLRGGAVAALVGFAVQCVWETPLVTPTLLWLVSIVAGLAMHRTPAPEPAEDASLESHARATT